LLGFGKYVGLDNELEFITENKCSEYIDFKGMQNGKATSYWFCIYSAIEGLYQWAIIRGYINNCAHPKYKPNQPETFKPYIYSNDELKRLFSAAISYRKHFNTLYSEVIQIMLKVTYGLGLHPSETVNLHVNDIDIANGIVYIRETKFYKSRMIPVENQVLGMIKQYVSWRVNAVRKTTSNDNHLFLDKKRQPVKLSALQQAFRLVCDMVDVHRNDTSQCDVRLQDLRYHYLNKTCTI
jgi:site-specific recombinase XerD